MAKKTVAGSQANRSKNFTKVIKMVKSDKGSYSFKQEVVPNEKVREFIDSK
jgi:hypothetical protein